MTNNPSTTDVRYIHPADTRRRQIRAMQLLFAGAAAVATLALFGAAQPGGGPVSFAASGSAPGVTVVPVDDTDSVNDNGQTSGDIFEQNAQDQSTASGAGT